MRITDLAEELIRLSGFEPGVDIEIAYSGVRPGEKLYEELSFDAEKMTKTQHAKIFVGKLHPCEMKDVERGLETLAKVTASLSASEVRQALGAVVPEMHEPALPQSEREPQRRQRAGKASPKDLRPATVQAH